MSLFPETTESRKETRHKKIPPGPSGVLQPVLRGCTRKAIVTVILIDIILPYQIQNASIVSDSSYGTGSATLINSKGHTPGNVCCIISAGCHVKSTYKQKVLLAAPGILGCLN